MNKRLLTIALLLCLAAALLPASALADGEESGEAPAAARMDEPAEASASDSAASGTCGEELTWTLDEDGVLTVSGTGDMRDFFTQWDQPWFDTIKLQPLPITAVVIEDGVTGIGSDAFYGCQNLTTVSIPDSVTRIGGAAFSSCTALTGFIVSDGNPYFTAVDGVLFDRELTTLIVYPAGKQEQTYAIPDGVTTIGGGAFYDSRNLLGITIPESVTCFEEYAIGWCVNLQEITIPDSVTSIGSSAFYACHSLRLVTLGSGLTSIDNSVFTSCCSLTEITIPAGVTSIGKAAFSGCGNLTDVYYGGSESDWADIMIGGYNDPLLNARIHFAAAAPESTAEPEPPTLIFNEEGAQVTVSGDFSDLYVRVALALDNGGMSGLFVTQADVDPDGTVIIPAFYVPGLTVTGVNVALVPNLEDVSSPTPVCRAMTSWYRTVR